VWSTSASPRWSATSQLWYRRVVSTCLPAAYKTITNEGEALSARRSVRHPRSKMSELQRVRWYEAVIDVPSGPTESAGKSTSWPRSPQLGVREDDADLRPMFRMRNFLKAADGTLKPEELLLPAHQQTNWRR